jgi:hypothetical protein
LTWETNRIELLKKQFAHEINEIHEKKGKKISFSFVSCVSWAKKLIYEQSRTKQDYFFDGQGEQVLR